MIMPAKAKVFSDDGIGNAHAYSGAQKIPGSVGVESGEASSKLRHRFISRGRHLSLVTQRVTEHSEEQNLHREFSTVGIEAFL